MLSRSLPAGFIAPCLPTKTNNLPAGGQWLHEIKHDGFRIIARKDGERVRLYSRPGNDLTRRFPLIVETTRVRSRKIATARHCRRGPACVYPVIRDGFAQAQVSKATGRTRGPANHRHSLWLVAPGFGVLCGLL